MRIDEHVLLAASNPLAAYAAIGAATGDPATAADSRMAALEALADRHEAAVEGEDKQRIRALLVLLSAAERKLSAAAGLAA